jgi:hypothetical protein
VDEQWERGWCHRCRRDTLQRRSGGHNGNRPVDQWLCTSCGNERVQLADVRDAEALLQGVLWKHVKGNGHFSDERSLDVEDFRSFLWIHLMRLYEKWQPTGGLSFASYGSGLLGRRANVWYRERFGRQGHGRDTRKALAHADSLDRFLQPDGPLAQEGDGDEPGSVSPARGLAGAVGASHGDAGDDRSPDCYWALAQGSGLALGPYAGASGAADEAA